MAGRPGGWQKQLQDIGKDWNCGLCGAFNDQKRTHCFKCGNLHHVGGGMRSVAGRDSYYNLPKMMNGLGEWLCILCRSQNYANRTTCFKCGAGKIAQPGDADYVAPVREERIHPAITTGKLPARVYLDIAIGGAPVGRIEIILEASTPKTSDNFRCLCIGNRGPTYQGSTFHRVIPGFMLQGGDFTNHDGTGGQSIYGRKFEDENFRFKHNKAGIVSMANGGPNTNGSQFFIICKPAPHLDGKHVVFGHVDQGMETVRAIEAVGTKGSGKTSQKVVIVKCGQLRFERTKQAEVQRMAAKGVKVRRRQSSSTDSDERRATKRRNKLAAKAAFPFGKPRAGVESDSEEAGC